MQRSHAESFSISQLCAEFSVTPRALRFYETKGLLRPDRDGRGRVYSANDRARLALVLRGKRVGFSLDEIAEMLDLHEMNPDERGALADMRGKLIGRLEDLRGQRKDIEAAIADLEYGCAWLDERLANREPSEDLKSRAAAFEALARSFINGDGAAAAVADE